MACKTPASTRVSRMSVKSTLRGLDPIPEDGKGNHEFNTYDEDWHGYGFAYRVRSVRKLRNPLTLAMMKEKYGSKLAPRGLVYLQAQISADIPWDEQELIWTNDGKPEDDVIAVAESEARAFARKRKCDEGVSAEATRPTKYSR
ncbi:hypothetical protein EXIGLDRAFT_725848 [Exidia glandulosa HHB12029]|uniref:Uncharacterized protein n=1 Tax=Exidia glandulosa HHB12029 TaxID=1314781 RepID=A0A165MG32_EXIGL|nr:hypothetical protein EXIGLDRAFT_725848 [Exidia glandulosa HHB12029]